MVEVNLPNRAALDALVATGMDVAEYVRHNDDGTITTQVMGTDEELAALAEAGYSIGATVQDYNDYLARMAERQAAIDASNAAQRAAENGSTSSVQQFGLRSIVFANAAPEVVIQRVDYFQNYGGRFISVEAFDAATNYSGTAGPTLALSWAADDGVYSTAVNMSRYIDGDPTPDTYMFHRVTIRIGPVGSTTPVPKTVRVATSTVGEAPVVAPVTEFVTGNPQGEPYPIGFQSHFFDHYMDPTELYSAFENIATEYPNITQLISMPNLTAGYQRKSAAIMYPLTTTIQAAAAPAGATQIRLASVTGVAAGTVLNIDTGANQEFATVASVITPNPASPAPNVNLTAPLALAHAAGATVLHGAGNIGSAPAAALQPATVVLTATKFGQNGGNATRAQFLNPGMADAPLSVSVVPNFGGQKDVVVSLATDSAGRLTSTAAQVVSAINANPAAVAEMSAETWASNAGAGIVQPHAAANLSDFLNAPASVQRGPFRMKVLRIGKVRDGSKTGIYIYCQEHAREWVTPLTCYELAMRLTKNYATDAETKDFVDNLDIFIVPVVNPDGAHHSFYDFASQRKNLPNYCAPGTTSAMPSGRNGWGTDLNRNNTQYTLFDGYFGASTSCTSEVYSGPSELSEAETRNSHWVVDTFSNIKFSMNTHSSGGLFMWAPGSYIGPGRVTAPAPNIGIEGYFWQTTNTTLQRIKEFRGTVINPQTTGPIADVLYSAAGNSADDYWYRKGIIAYSFEVGADRTALPLLQVASVAGATGVRATTTAGMTVGNEIRIDVGKFLEVRTITAIVTPNPASPAANVLLDAPLTLPHVTSTQLVTNGTSTGSTVGVGFMPSFAVEGQWEGMEFANGHYGLLEGALAYQRDHTAPTSSMITLPEGSPMASPSPISATFKWGNEPSVIYYTLDGSTPTIASPKWEAQGPRRPGEIFTFNHTTTVKWFGVDIVGNTGAVQSATFAVDADAPETTASLSPAPQNGYYRAPFVTLIADDDIDGGGSGIASTEYKLDGAAAWTTYSGPFQVTSNGSHTLVFRSTDNAGNVEADKSITFMVDATAPTVTVTTPPNGATYTLDQKVKASYLCSDGQSGLLSCVGSVANGAYIATNTAGPKTFTVTGTDKAGNTTTVTRTYNVFWPFDGFEDPLDAKPGKYVEEKAGDDIDVTFSLGGDRGMNILAVGSPYSQKVNCSDYSPAKGCGKAKRLKKRMLARQQGEDFGSLKYDKKKKQYTFEWETDKSWRGTCRMLVVQLTDGSVHSVVVRFK